MSTQQPRQAILSSESQTVQGDDAQSMNLAAGKAIGEVVRTTLGPRGMDKLLIDDAGMGIVTNDGASIIREMDIEHPAANMVATVGKKQEEIVGDGTTTAVVIASKLLEEAETLLDQGLHPTLIAEGYALAIGAATEEITEMTLDLDDQTTLVEGVIGTTLKGKSSINNHESLIDVVTEAAMSAGEADANPETHVDVITDVGGTVGDTWLMDGVVIKKERAHPEMPAMVEDATVVVIDNAIEVSDHTEKTSITLEDSAGLNSLQSSERKQLDDQVDHLLDLGVDVVITEGNVANQAQHRFADHGVYVARRQSPEGVETAARATGATIASEASTVSAADLGAAGTVAERIVGGDVQTSIEDIPRKNAISIVLRGGTRNVVDEVHRAIDDALATAGVVLQNDAVVPGGGGAEAFAAARIRDRATGVDDRLQLAIAAFANTLEIIPWTLAENTGRNTIDCIVELRHAYDTGETAAMIDAETGAIVDAREARTVDALAVKTRALENATQVATMLLRIDDVVAAGGLTGGTVTNDRDGEDDK